jgi:hypothetical protein
MDRPCQLWHVHTSRQFNVKKGNRFCCSAVGVCARNVARDVIQSVSCHDSIYFRALASRLSILSRHRSASILVPGINLPSKPLYKPTNDRFPQRHSFPDWQMRTIRWPTRVRCMYEAWRFQISRTLLLSSSPFLVSWRKASIGISYRSSSPRSRSHFPIRSSRVLQRLGNSHVHGPYITSI